MNIDVQLHLDKDAIKSALKSRVEGLAHYLLPAGKRVGQQFVVGDLDNHPGQSMRIQLVGPNCGRWIDHATGDKGDVFGLIAATQKITEFPDVLQMAADWLGDLKLKRPADCERVRIRIPGWARGGSRGCSPQPRR